MITRFKNALRGFQRGWRTHPPVNGRGWRPAWLPSDYYCTLESKVHPHVAAEKSELFLAYNAGSTEMETLNWLHATICLVKPSAVLETGAADGLGTIALASACRDNGFGQVHSLEIDAGLCERLEGTLRKYGLSDYAKVHCADSLSFLRQSQLSFDFGFFDSLCELRVEEYRICRNRRILDGIAAFHDTAPQRAVSLTDCPPADIHDEYRRQLLELAGQPDNSGFFEHTLSRGLFVIYPHPRP